MDLDFVSVPVDRFTDFPAQTVKYFRLSPARFNRFSFFFRVNSSQWIGRGRHRVVQVQLGATAAQALVEVCHTTIVVPVPGGTVVGGTEEVGVVGDRDSTIGEGGEEEVPGMGAVVTQG